MSPIYFVKQMKRDDVPLVSFTVKGLKCRYLLTLKDNLFSGSKENSILFSFSIVQSVQYS